MIRVGIIGLGVISRFYLAAIRAVPGWQLVAVCERSPLRLAPFRGRARMFTDHREMLAEGGLDAVLVLAPNDTHARLCLDALSAGLAVCVEKPLATTVGDGRAVVEAAGAHDVALFTAFHRRYNRHVQGLAVQLGPEPPIRELTVRYFERIEEHVGGDRWYLDPGRCGGGCVADNGSNALDLAQVFLGPLVLTDAEIRRDSAGIDRHAVLAVRGRAPATLELDWSYPGERKTVEIEKLDGTRLLIDLLEGWPGFTESLWHEYEGVLAAFGDAVRTRSRADSGLQALELVGAAYGREGMGAGKRGEGGGRGDGGEGAGASA
jgi:predicted dehydrogenase